MNATRKHVLRAGDTYGHLTVIGPIGRKGLWDFKCTCGKLTQQKAYMVVNGFVSSCGCARGRKPKHGQATRGGRSKIYGVWRTMIARCRYPSSDSFKDYGGRGIKVCDRWQGSDGFQNFYADMGELPSPQHTIERNDNNGNYEPGNCRWATRLEQRHNTRPRIYPQGEKHGSAKLSETQLRDIFARIQDGEGLSEIARDFAISRPTISAIKHGRLWRHVTGLGARNAAEALRREREERRKAKRKLRN